MILSIFFISILNVLFILIFSKYATTLNLIDIPSTRKNHKGEVPLIGGIVIYSSIFIFNIINPQDYWVSVIIYSTFIIVLMGAIDDSFQLGVTIRLISQVIGSLIILGSGLKIINFGTYAFLPNFDLGIFSVFITIISVVALTNAINFMDGVDGLSAGLTFVSLVTLIMYSLFFSDFHFPPTFYFF